MKYSGIGGQAVMEGVMMRNGGKYAVAVRKPDQTIEVKVDDYKVAQKGKWRKIPIVRGVISFIDSLYLGMSTLMYSASFFEEEEDGAQTGAADTVAKSAQADIGSAEIVSESEQTDTEQMMSVAESAGADIEQAEILSESEQVDAERSETVVEGIQPDTGQSKTVAKSVPSDVAAQDKKNKKKEKQLTQEQLDKKKQREDNLFMTGTVIFSVVFAVAIFFLLPYGLSSLLRLTPMPGILIVLVEGILRLAIFIAYLAVISLNGDIKRTYMYHGAEHKCINCVEHGLPLDVEHVRESSREHKRCGTSFLLIVVIISIFFFMFIQVKSRVLRLVLRLVLIPIIAGVSYEIIQFMGRHDGRFVNALSRPGLMVQKLTTAEPDDDMIEVGIASVNAVFDWKKWQQDNGLTA